MLVYFRDLVDCHLPAWGVGRRFLFHPKSLPVASNVFKQFGVHYEQGKAGTGDLAYAWLSLGMIATWIQNGKVFDPPAINLRSYAHVWARFLLRMDPGYTSHKPNTRKPQR